ncbi:MAG TPA: hypothetical protein DCR97_05955 [Deltaproteobacteria bacterium]|nr:hypothetical protein [Deltaproteobacteria bacterium]
MIRPDDIENFIDQQDPYIEDLVLTVNKMRKRERPGLKRLLLEIVKKIRPFKEGSLRKARFSGSSVLQAILVAAGIAALYGAARAAQSLSGSSAKYGHSGGLTAGAP